MTDTQGTKRAQGAARPDVAGARIGVLAQFVSLSVWQTGLIVQKLLVAESDVQSVMLLQLGLASIVMLLALTIFTGVPQFNRRNAANLAWGLIAPGLVFAFGIAGAARTDGVSVVMIWGTFPLVGAITARLLIREPLHWTFTAAGIVSFMLVTLLADSRSESGAGDLIGNLLVLLSVVCASIGMVIGRIMNRQPKNWFRAATLQITGAAIGALALTAILGFDPPDLLARSNVLATLYLVFFMTVTNFLAYSIALARVGVATLSLNASFAPLIGLAAAWVILDTQLGVVDLIFAGLIVAAVAFPHLWRRAVR